MSRLASQTDEVSDGTAGTRNRGPGLHWRHWSWSVPEAPTGNNPCLFLTLTVPLLLLVRRCGGRVPGLTAVTLRYRRYRPCSSVHLSVGRFGCLKPCLAVPSPVVVLPDLDGGRSTSPHLRALCVSFLILWSFVLSSSTSSSASSSFRFFLLQPNTPRLFIPFQISLRCFVLILSTFASLTDQFHSHFTRPRRPNHSINQQLLSGAG